MNDRPTHLLLSALLLLAGVQVSHAAAAAEEREQSRADTHPQGRPVEIHPQGRPDMHPQGPPAEVRPERRAPDRSSFGPGRDAGRPALDGRGQFLDQRYNHGRYYPPAGTVLPALPSGYRPYYHGRDRYYFNGGVWYAPRGPGFVVVQPPVGLMIAVLPTYCATVWIGGIPYYYADNVYYTWQPEQNGYIIVDPPANADQPSPPPDASQGAPDDLIIYPRNGQSADQQAADRYECNKWAKNQTGFDPTEPDGGVQAADADRARSNYYRAMTACLQGRGYQVN